MIVEVCANSYESANKTEQAGANRIELCKDLHLDGLTPDYGIAKKTIDILKIPVFILIRPRAGDFVYTNEEFKLMKSDIMKFKKLGCNGIVSGVLNTDNTIDTKRTKELIELSRPLEFTFHRAFDKVINPLKAMENLIKLGVNRILTSGQEDTAIRGLKLLKELNKINNNRIIILPGAGMKTKFFEIFSKAGFKEIHGSFKSEITKV